MSHVGGVSGWISPRPPQRASVGSGCPGRRHVEQHPPSPSRFWLRRGAERFDDAVDVLPPRLDDGHGADLGPLVREISRCLVRSLDVSA